MIAISKRMMTVFLAAVMLLCSLMPVTVWAADVTMDLSKAEVSWDYTLTDADGNAFTAAYGLKAEDNPFGYAIGARVRKMHDYTAKRPGLTGNKSDWEYGKDYLYCYCIEHGVPLPDNDNYSGSSNATHGDKYEKLSENQKTLLHLALAYGYPNRTDLETSKDANACYSATQLIIWQITLGFRTSPTGLNDKTYPMSGYSGTMTEQYTRNRYFKEFYDRILEDMADHYKRPSFTVAIPSAAKTYEMEYKDGKYTLTLTDTNNVLSGFYVSASSGVSTRVSGNTLTLTSSKPINTAATLKLTRRMPSTGHTTAFLIWSVPGKEKENQDMVSGVPADNDPVPSFFKVMTAAGSLKIVKTSEDGIVDGLSFRVQGDGVDQTVTTKNGGQIQLDNLRPGVFTVTEQSYDKYEPQETRRVTVVSGQTATVTFSNTLKRGDLVVTKTSEDGLNEGVKFHLFGTSLAGLSVNEYAVTDSTGKAYFKDVLIGTGYTLEEVNTDVRYVVPEKQTAAVEWNKVTNKSFNNILKKWQLTVTKSDAETGTAQGDASLAGAVYGIYKGGQLIDRYTTDWGGQFTTKEYICDSDWSLREISPSEGYLLNTEALHIGAEPELYEVEYNAVALDSLETVRKGNISIIKHTDDGSTQIETPEIGAEFSVYLKSAGSYEAARNTERDYLVCDKNGYAETKYLPYGVYTVHQVKGWNGRELFADFDVYIAEDGRTYRYLANNAGFESYIKIVKVDAETGKTIPYAGAGFQLFRPDGSKITQTYTYPEVTTIDTFYTGGEGFLITPEALAYGTGYSLLEVSAPYSYVLDSTPVYFDVTADNASEENAVTVVTVTKRNVAQKGVIKIKKTGEVFASVTETEGIYQPVYAVKGLPGAVYEITAAEDIYTPDGTLRYAAGETVDTVTTDETGVAASKPLYLGKFNVFERTAPQGMVLNKKVYTAELVYAGQEIEITETAASFYNERQKAAVSLDKVLEQNMQFGIGMNGEISAVTFGLFAGEDLTAADGSVIPADGLLEILSVDEDGHAVCKTDLPFGNFYLQELSTDNRYILSNAKYPIAFRYAGQDAALVEIKANDGKQIDNKLIYGKIHGLKKDDGSDVIGGAVFGLFKADCTEFTEDNALMLATSAEDGSFAFTKVPYGNWIVRELSVAPCYVMSEESYDVTVDQDGAVIELEIENTRIRGTVQLTKVDKDYPENKLTGAVFEVYRDANGDKALDSGDELIGTMSETETGVYEMADLVYGGFFLKEQTAPAGFCLDENAYYFEITEHGKTVLVENAAGIGFVNAPQRGSLKIVKTSEDGKLAGFSFLVTGANGYSEVFTTDEKGEILIENLRIGDYTVREISNDASAGYVLPADKTASVLNGAVTIVEMHNKLRDYPDSPQTGDNSNMPLWWGLMGASAAGIVAVTAGRKKRIKEDAE